jgi:hypothetical protein
MTQEELKDVVEELISVLKLTENGKPIEITEDTDLENFIKEAIPLIELGDKFTPSTTAFISEFKGKPKEKHKKPLEFVPEEIPDIPEEPTSLTDEINSAERLKDLKEIAVAENQFKKIRGILSGFKTVDELKVVMLKMLETPAQEEVAEKLHQKIEELPINATKEQKEEVLDLPDQSELVGRGTMKTNLIRTKNPFNSLFSIDAKVLSDITESIKVNGYDSAFPVILWKDVVVDGHTRLTSALANGLKEIPVLQKEFKDEQEALDYAIHNQRARRNLSEADLLHCIAAIDKPMTKVEAGSKGGLSNPESKITKIEPTHKVTAEVLGIGQSKVTDARVVLANVDAIKEVESGKKTISGAAKEIREKKPKKEKIVKKILQPENWLAENKITDDITDWNFKLILNMMTEYAIYYPETNNKNYEFKN